MVSGEKKVRKAFMSDSGTGKFAGKCWGWWRRGGVFGTRPARRRKGEGRKLAVDTLEERATVSDVLLSLLWSSTPAVFVSDPVGEAGRGEASAIYWRSSEAGQTSNPGQFPAVSYDGPVARTAAPGDPASPASIGQSAPTAVTVEPAALPDIADLASALAGLQSPAHRPQGSASAVGALPSSGAVPTDGNPGGSPSGAGVVASGGSVVVSPVATGGTPIILPANGQGDTPPPPAKRGFKVSWVAGQTDDAGNLTGGTELTNMVAHDGKIYAGTSLWKDAPGSEPVVGAQVLRLDSPRGRWQVDLNLSQLLDDGTPRYLRISALNSVTFTTDGTGHRLASPVSMLLAAAADNAGTLSVFSRDDSTGAWTEMDVFPAGAPAGFRSFGFHHDNVTHIDRVFAGAGIFGIFAGVYDPTAPGSIRWNTLPQLLGQNRPMAFAEVNNTLYVAIDPGIYARVDGLVPHWQMVYQFTDPPYQTDGLRGLTTVPNPSGNGDVLLASLEGPLGYIGYVDPAAAFANTQELYFLPYFLRRWGSLPQSYVVAAYNDTTPIQDPKTGEPLELIGLEAQDPQPGHENSSWYLVRHLDGTYDLHEIPAIATPENPNPSLVATRAIVVSPFAEDRGKTVYFGGYDASWDASDHNTAWIYRAPLSTVLRG
jgi:hypothetical protein